MVLNEIKTCSKSKIYQSLISFAGYELLTHPDGLPFFPKNNCGEVENSWPCRGPSSDSTCLQMFDISGAPTKRTGWKIAEMGWKTLKNCFQSVLTVSKTDMKPKTRVWIELKMEVLPQVLASLDLACTSNLYPCRFLKMTKNIKIVELLAFQILRRTSRSSDWLVVYLPLWKIWVSWDDYSRYMKKKQVMFQTTNQQWFIIPFPKLGSPKCSIFEEAKTHVGPTAVRRWRLFCCRIDATQEPLREVLDPRWGKCLKTLRFKNVLPALMGK